MAVNLFATALISLWGNAAMAMTLLTRFCQRIREEVRNRLALVYAVAAVARVQVTALFKLIELILRHDDRPHEEATFPAFSVPGKTPSRLPRA